MNFKGIELPPAYYRDEWVYIIHGDCREILPSIPDKSIDLVLTDPPYGVGDMVSGTMGKNRLHKTRYLGFQDSIEYVQSVVIPAIELCLVKSQRMIVTPGFKCLKYYPQWDSFGCFYMPSACGMQLWGSGDNQPIVYYGKPYDIGHKIKKCSYVLIEKPSCEAHPCSKPLNIWKRIVSDRADIGHLVLDPFLGSGTTAVASKHLYRYCIGIEIEEKYCEIAAKRCCQSVMELNV